MGPATGGERMLAFVLELLAGQVIEAALVRWWADVQVLRGIEQATFDREFADLIGREFGQ